MPDNTPEYIKRVNAALTLREIPDYHAALAQLKIAAEQAAEDASVHLLLGLTYQDLEEWEDSVPAFRRVLALEPQSQDAKRGLGISLIHLDQDQEAVDLLTPINSLEPENLPIAQALAQGLTNLDCFQLATQVLQSARTHHIDDTSLSIQLAEVYEKQKQFDRAIEVLQEAIAQHPTPDLLEKQGDLYLRQNYYDEAIELFQKATELDPTYATAWADLARAHLEKEDLDAALAIADQGLAINPLNIRILQIKAEIFGSQEKKTECLSIYQEIISLLREQQSFGQIEIFFILHVLKLWEYQGAKKALAQLEKYADDPVADPKLLVSFRVSLLIRLAKYKEAVTLLRSIKEPKPTSSYMRDLFIALYGAGQPQEAFAYLREQLSENKLDKNEIIDYLDNAAVGHYERGERQAAQDFLEFSLEIDANDARALNNLGFILIGEQQWERAQDLLQQAIQNGYNEPDITDANRAYIYIRQGMYPEAIEILEHTMAEPGDSQNAILRIIFPMPDRLYVIDHPERFIVIPMAVAANLAAARYLAGYREEAFYAAHEAIESDPEDCIGYAMMGCLEFCSGSSDKAVKIWRKALRKNKSKPEKAMIQAWIGAAMPE